MKIIYFLVFIIVFCRSSIACNNIIAYTNLPSHYSSYKSAVQMIQSARFRIKESVNTSKSSWVRSASYYSCDGVVGYFILRTDNKEYLYEGVPVVVWEEFKYSESCGSYCDRNIKWQYILIP